MASYINNNLLARINTTDVFCRWESEHRTPHYGIISDIDGFEDSRPTVVEKNR